MSFEFPHTCPDIDAAIDDARSIISDSLDDIVGELSPKFQEANDGIDKDNFVSEWTESIMETVKEGFEKARQSNIDMRKEAERQVEELEDKVSEKEEYINNINEY